MHRALLSGEDRATDTGLYPVDEVAANEVKPWEQIEAGRYMPRRIRGSFRGRTLG